MKKCPICKGTGEIPIFKRMPLNKKIGMAKKLKSDTYSVRQIMRIMGYKSPKSVQDLLTK